MSTPTLPGIRSQMIQTERIDTHVLTCGAPQNEPIVFIHGNFSAATYWEETMLALCDDYFCLAPDLRGYGDTEGLPVDATRGAKDWTDDLKALSDAYGDRAAHLVGWSLGGGVVMQFLLDYPQLVRSLTLLNPISPYGFGGTKGLDGVPCYGDCAGSGGGVVNPEFIRRVKEGDRSADDPNSPRNVMRTFYYKPPFEAAREEDFLTAALLQQTGEESYPGDATPSENWPAVAPGKFGPINATSPKYFNTSGIAESSHKPPILWVRGDSDQIVSDNSMFDMGALGKMGFVPGWPGEEVYPPQPAVSQTRAVLEQYEANGGSYKEIVIADAGHGAHIEKPRAFVEALRAHLQQ